MQLYTNPRSILIQTMTSSYLTSYLSFKGKCQNKFTFCLELL